MPTGWNQESQRLSRGVQKESAAKVDMNETANDDEAKRVELFIPEEPVRNFDDLIIPQSVRIRIETALNRVIFHDVLYNEWNLKKIDPYGSRIAINLFGPPGTGKTFCAEAIARFLKKKIIRINYAEIESKYVGDTPKNITAAFKKARETSAVLFFDEADSILGKRLTNVTQSADHGVNVSRAAMLKQLDEFDGVVLFATNLARNYDDAFVRRILAHIEFDLPDYEGRVKLWQYLIPGEVPLQDDVTGEWLASESDGLSGGDILNVVISATSRAVQRPRASWRVSRHELQEEIKNLINAKQKVGSSVGEDQTRLKTEQVLNLDQLPPDARQRFDQFDSKNNTSGA